MVHTPKDDNRTFVSQAFSSKFNLGFGLFDMHTYKKSKLIK